MHHIQAGFDILSSMPPNSYRFTKEIVEGSGAEGKGRIEG
jgi:hypothetical protein